MSFDYMLGNVIRNATGSQSLSSRAMSFDLNEDNFNPEVTSQSLSSRAMSLDTNGVSSVIDLFGSQSLSSRAMSLDCSGMLEAGIMRPFRPTSQFFWKVKELALDLSK